MSKRTARGSKLPDSLADAVGCPRPSSSKKAKAVASQKSSRDGKKPSSKTNSESRKKVKPADILEDSCEEFPHDPFELLKYAKKKWGNFSWTSGDRYVGIGKGFDVINQERKQGYSMYSAQNAISEILKEIFTSEITKIYN